MLKLEHLSFSYIKDKKVLDDISFDIDKGEVVILLGPNGVGKSTLLSLIVGSNKIQEGDIYFDDNSMKDVSYKDKGKFVAYVPQNIYGSDLSVLDTVLLGRLPYYKIYPNKFDYQQVDNILARFNLLTIKDKCTNEISGGERQKVNIARSFIQDTDYVLFDEPTSNLDVKASLEVLKIIEEEKQHKGFLISMHDINESLKIGDMFVFLKNGKIYRILKKEEINEDVINEVYEIKSKIHKINKEVFITYED